MMRASGLADWWCIVRLTVLLLLMNWRTVWAFRASTRPFHTSQKPPGLAQQRRGEAIQQASSADAPGPAQATSAVEFRGKRFEVAQGKLLRTAMLENGVSPHNGRAKLINCRGLGTCGTCAVQVVPSGAVEPPSWTTKEQLRLSFPPHRSPGNAKLRLACQCRVPGGGQVVRVVKFNGFWGQGDQPSDEPAEAFELPFGELEYVLDRDRSPPPTDPPAGRS